MNWVHRKFTKIYFTPYTPLVQQNACGASQLIHLDQQGRASQTIFFFVLHRFQDLE